MNSTFDEDQLLWDINNGKAILFVPAIIFVGLLMIIGAVGNGMVLFFYGCKTKSSPSASFIFTLAIFDLVSCLVGMPMEIADMRYYFNFKSEPACRTLRLVTHFASISSGLALVVIAMDRYRRICKPFERQLNNKHVKIVCISIGIISILLSWPAVVFNNVVEVEITTDQGVTITGHDCTTTKSENLKPYVFASNVIYLVAFVIVTVVLAVLYGLISRQLFKHKRFRFYVAKRSSNIKRINVQPENGSSEALITPRDRLTVTDTCPDDRDSVVYRNTFTTNHLPEVEHDRPTSGYTAVTGTTSLTGLTDITGRSRLGMLGRKSVQICDPSKNQVYAIESREASSRYANGSENPTLADGEIRPGSAASMTSFSSRPSSDTTSMFSDIPRNRFRLKQRETSGKTHIECQYETDENGDTFDDSRQYKPKHIGHKGVTFLSSREKTTEWLNKSMRYTSPIIEANEDGGTPVNTESHALNENVSSNVTETQENSHDESDDINDENKGVVDNQTSLDKKDMDIVASNLDDGNENNGDNQGEIGTKAGNEVDNEDNIDKALDLTLQDNDETCYVEDARRPESKESVRSRKSKDSSRSRTNMISPATDVTGVSSVASRASTVRRMKRMLYNSEMKGSRNGKVDTDTDNVKDLRMKLLDINTVKYTMIMLVITILFVLSFLPYLALVIWRYYNEDHEANIMSDFELVMFQIGMRSIFLNSSLNPLVYGGFNSKFRAFFYGLLCKCCASKGRKRRKGQPNKEASESTSD